MSLQASTSSRCMRTGSEVSTLIRSLGKAVTIHGPRTPADIASFEASFSLQLPPDYRQFLLDFGALLAPQLAILGLGRTETTGFPVSAILLLLRVKHLQFPMSMLPVEDLGNGHLACLDCSPGRSGNSPVFDFDLGAGATTGHPQLAACFWDYLYARLKNVETQSRTPAQGDQDNEKALAVLEQHVHDYQAAFDYDHAKGGKLPRNTDWRPYRYCIQDVLFGATVVRHWPEGNCLDVDVFLAAYIPEYDRLAGAQALAAFLLSEAYKCGGSMEIRFTKNVEGGRVPHGLQELAGRYRLSFPTATSGRIAPAEAKALYAALTGFSQPLQEKISALEQDGKVTMARCCYVVHHGMWTKEQVEMIVLGSQRPESVLAGAAQPEQYHLYMHDLLHARAALLAGLLDLRLAKRDRQAEDGTPYDLEDDVRPLTIDFDERLYARRYESTEDLPLPAWQHGRGQAAMIRTGRAIQVLVRGRDAADLRFNLGMDIKTAQAAREQSGLPTFLLVPGDFVFLPERLRTVLVGLVETAQVGLLVCPESTLGLDADAAARLARSRVLRQ